MDLRRVMAVLPFMLAGLFFTFRGTRGWTGFPLLFLFLIGVLLAFAVRESFVNLLQCNKLANIPDRAAVKLKKWLVFLIFFLLYWGVAFLLNLLFFALAPLLLLFIFVDTKANQWTLHQELIRGGGLSMVVPATWFALRGSVDWQPFVMALGVLLWKSGIYAISAIRDYEIGLVPDNRSLVVSWGVKNVLSYVLILHLAAIMSLTVFGFLATFRIAYMVAMGFICFIVLVEHWIARLRRIQWAYAAFDRLDLIVCITYMIAVGCEIVFPFFNFSRQ